MKDRLACFYQIFKEEIKTMKVAIYCRLSEEDKNKPDEVDSESIQNQKSMLVQYAIDRQWEIYHIYSDDDYTGADRNRPEYNKLLIDAEKGKFDIVLCKTQSRFTREMEMLEKYIHGLFPLWGIRFVSIVDNADTDVKGNKKSRQINGLVNEWYLEDLSDNIKSVLHNKMKQGHYIGSTALYGYKKDPNKKGHLIIDDEAAEIVREIFNMYDQGYGKSTIAQMLNERGIPNPTEYKRLKGIAYKTPAHKSGTLWKYYAISDMLINLMYAGHMVQGKYENPSYNTKISKPTPKDKWIIVRNTHEPIIDKDLWERVQLKIQTNFRPFSGNEVGLFARKIKCVNCGYTMRTGKTRDIRYFKCTTKHVSKDACIGAFISYKKIISIVTDQLDGFMSQYLDKDELEKNISLSSGQNDRQKQLNDRISTYEKKLDDYTRAINEAYFDKVKGLIDEDEFVAISKEAREQKNTYIKMLDESNKQIEAFDKRKDTLTDKKQVIEDFLNTRELNRVLIDTLIDHINVGRNDKTTKQQLVEIYWKF